MGQARNICLVGHSGSGKTTLAAALLKKAGIKDQITFDASPEGLGAAVEWAGSCLVQPGKFRC